MPIDLCYFVKVCLAAWVVSRSPDPTISCLTNIETTLAMLEIEWFVLPRKIKTQKLKRFLIYLSPQISFFVSKLIISVR